MMSKISKAKVHSENIDGTVVQTLDVLDFSVIHLSAYERLQRRWNLSVPDGHMKLGSLKPIHKSSEILKEKVNSKNGRTGSSSSATTRYTHTINRTVAIMPFLLNDIGSGNSFLENRKAYLYACFWSVYNYIPKVVISVNSQKDYNWVAQQSNLPFFEIILGICELLFYSLCVNLYINSDSSYLINIS